MRQAISAAVEYLLGFLALALFAYLAFGSATTSDEQFVFAFKASGAVAAAELATLLARATPANRLIIGANIWLIAGGMAALLEQWWFLRTYQQFGEASLFCAMLHAGSFQRRCHRPASSANKAHETRCLGPQSCWPPRLQSHC